MGVMLLSLRQNVQGVHQRGGEGRSCCLSVDMGMGMGIGMAMVGVYLWGWWAQGWGWSLVSALLPLQVVAVGAEKVSG